MLPVHNRVHHARPPPLSPRASLLFGLLFVASGIFPMLTAFDIGPLRREDIQGAPWLGFVAGGTFVAAGLAIFLQRGVARHAQCLVAAG